jgi:hypothetical protein
LVGLFMSIFVIGALGFGLMTVLATSQSENSKVKARTENSRALDFISDEVRRARTIETSAANAPNFTSATGKIVVLALDIPEISNSVTIASDNVLTTQERVVYYLKSTDLGNWKGPQVLYRWGPPLDANGNYDDGDWEEEALIDGIGVKKADGNLAVVSTPCATGTVTPANPTGFYACITGTNTAQLFLTGQTKTASGVNNDSQTNDTQVVARARIRAANTTNTFTAVNWSVKSLGGKYECKPGATASSKPLDWDMRTDFGNNSANPDQTTKWIQDADSGKQPQPIEVDSSKDLKITSSAIGETGCNSVGNEGKDGSEALSTYTTTLHHTINFGNPYTFNGDRNDTTAHNQSQVDTAKQGIRFLKKGEIPLFGGYVANPSSPSENDQPSLGKFLYEKNMAIIDPNYTWPTGKTLAQVLGDPNTKYIIPTAAQLDAYVTAATDTKWDTTTKDNFITLGDDQRIVAFEMGQTNPKLADNITSNPGFDLQDNIFVVTSDAFSKKYPSTDFVTYNSTSTP